MAECKLKDEKLGSNWWTIQVYIHKFQEKNAENRNKVCQTNICY